MAFSQFILCLTIIIFSRPLVGTVNAVSINSIAKRVRQHGYLIAVIFNFGPALALSI